MQDIKDLNKEELSVILKGWGEPVYHSGQVLSWTYKRGIVDFSRMSDLSLALRQKLEENFYILGLRPLSTQKSEDNTEKLLLQLKDGNLIESVIIPAKDRITGCVSTQVGCKFSCRFCASGLLGFKRNLATGEILEEALLMNRYLVNEKLTHIVFMGIGEPLDNYDFVLKAIRIINSDYGFNIGSRRITISSCGIIPGIKRLMKENLRVELSISLHAADDKTRSELMPVNKKYPLRELVDCCREYIRETDRQITFEYVLIRGLNSDLQSAMNLSKILKPLRLCKVNLIPANPINELGIEPPGKLEILFFRDYLLKQGVKAILRMPRGRDIEAACGQLRLRYGKE